MPHSFLVRCFSRAYRVLLYTYPPDFRRRYGREMAQVFGDRCREAAQARGLHGLLRLGANCAADWLITVFREGAAAMSTPAESHGASQPVSDGVPTFYTCENSAPPRSAFINGAALSLALFIGLYFAMAHWTSHATSAALLIGAHHHSRSHLFEVNSPTVAPGELDNEIKVKPERGRPLDVWTQVLSLLGSSHLPSPSPDQRIDQTQTASGRKSAAPAGLPSAGAASSPQPDESDEYKGWCDSKSGFPAAYFRVILVLGALDRDHDGIISPGEIANAPSALRGLDQNHDGKLTADECGLSLGALPFQGSVAERVRLAFMRFNPVLAVLDADHSGEISASEIQNAPAALRALDRNGDGRLTQDEVLPDPVANAVGLVMRLDQNGDGKISADERSGELASRYQDLLDAADQNKDGVVTEEELAIEIRRRAVLNGILTHK